MFLQAIIYPAASVFLAGRMLIVSVAARDHERAKAYAYKYGSIAAMFLVA